MKQSRCERNVLVGYTHCSRLHASTSYLGLLFDVGEEQSGVRHRQGEEILNCCPSKAQARTRGETLEFIAIKLALKRSPLVLTKPSGCGETLVRLHLRGSSNSSGSDKPCFVLARTWEAIRGIEVCHQQRRRDHEPGTRRRENHPQPPTSRACNATLQERLVRRVSRRPPFLKAIRSSMNERRR